MTIKCGVKLASPKGPPLMALNLQCNDYGYDGENSSDHCTCTSIKTTTRISCWSQARPATATGGQDGSPLLSTGSLAVIQYDHQSYQALTKDTNTHKRRTNTYENKKWCFLSECWRVNKFNLSYNHFKSLLNMLSAMSITLRCYSLFQSIAILSYIVCECSVLVLNNKWTTVIRFCL